MTVLSVGSDASEPHNARRDLIDSLTNAGKPDRV